MPLLVRAFPVLPGQENQLRQFARDMVTSRADEAAAFHRSLGVVRETWHLQETPHGTWAIAVSEVRDSVEKAGADYAASQAGFALWFKDQVRLVTGIDPEAMPLGPPTQCIFDSGPRF